MPIKAVFSADTQSAGIEPFSTLLTPVRNCLTRQPYAFRTMRQVNSLQIGVIRPAEYRAVCDRTRQSIRLAKSDLAAVCRLAQTISGDGLGFEWISVYIPAKLALRDDAASVIEKTLIAEKFENYSGLCVEMSADALYEDRDKILSFLKNIKALGLSTAFSAFGDEFCPVNRLFGLPVDFCIFDKGYAEKLQDPEGLRMATALAAFIKANDTVSIACFENDPPKPEVFLQSGFSGYTAHENDGKNWFLYDEYLNALRKEPF